MVPAGYLTALDVRFAPLAAIAVGMVPARPLAGAHTWSESIAGLPLGAVCLGAFPRLSSHRPTPTVGS